MQNPFVILTPLYMAGIIGGYYFPSDFWPLFCFSAAVAAAGWWWASMRPAILAALLVCCGWTHINFRGEIFSAADLRLVAGNNPHLAVARGVVVEPIAQRLYENDATNHIRSLAILRVEQVRLAHRWTVTTGKIAVSTPGVLDERFAAGQRVEVAGILRQPPLPAALGLFDYRHYLRLNRIYYQLAVESPDDWKIAGALAGKPLSERFLGWARQTLGRGLPEDEATRLIWSMGLGWKTGLTNEVAEPFMRSGTLHIFAISGLHIALIGFVVMSFLRRVRVPRSICGVITIPLIWFYTYATGWQSSAIRSAVMASVLIAGWSLKRPPNLINSLAGAAFLILLWQPEQLFQAGFQLSFVVVLSMGLLIPPMERRLDEWLQFDPFLPRSLVPPWRRKLRTVLRWIGLSLIVSVASFFGSLPVIAYYFNMVSPISLLSNFVIVPISNFALGGILASLATGSIAPPVAAVINQFNWYAMRLMIYLSTEFSECGSLAYFYAPSPGFGVFVIYYTLLLLALLGPGFWKGRPRLTLAASALCVAAATFLIYRELQVTRVSVLAAGGVVLVDGNGRKQDLLVDAGDSSSAERVLIPFLRAQGLNRLPALALTQGDIRRYGGAREVVKEFRIREVLTSPLRFRSAGYRKLLEEIDEEGAAHRTAPRGTNIGPWAVLHPAAEDNFPRADDKALVLKGRFGEVRILLLSDLGRLGQRRLMEREPDLKAEIVVAGIPDDGEPLHPDLLARINPEVIVVTGSDFPGRRRTPDGLRNRLRRAGGKLFLLEEHRSLQLVLRGNSYEVQGWIEDFKIQD